MTFSLEKRQIVSYKHKKGTCPNGQVLLLFMSELTLLLYGSLPHNEKFPDDAEFASTVKSVEQVSLFGIDFFKTVISICHKQEEMYVPLYFKKELLIVGNPTRKEDSQLLFFHALK